MYIKKLFFPGEFDVAYVYMQKLILINPEGALFFVDLTEVAANLNDQLESIHRFVPTLLFENNRPFDTKRLKWLVSNQYVKDGLVAAVETFPDEQRLGPALVHPIATIEDVEEPLDVTVYYERAYIGTDEGAFHVDLDINTNTHDVGVGDSRKRLDALTAEITTNYGAINMSCGNDGLFTVFGEFGRSENAYFHNAEPRLTAERSLRTSWVKRNLLNYEAANSLQYKIVTHGTKKRPDKETGKKRKEDTVQEYSGSHNFSDLISSRINTENILSIFNSGASLLIQEGNMHLTRFGVSKEKGSPLFKTITPEDLDVELSRVLSVPPYK